MDNNEFLDLTQNRAKKSTVFIGEASKEAYRQLSILNDTRLVLIATSAVTSAAMGFALGRWLGRR